MNDERFGQLINAVKDVSDFRRESDMKERWFEFCEELGMSRDWAVGVYYLLQKLYNLPEKSRHYHTWSGHILDCMEELDLFEDGSCDGLTRAQFLLVRYCLVTHDSFYNANKTNGVNEYNSADLAKILLVDTPYEEQGQLCWELVYSTYRGLPPVNAYLLPLCSLMCDIDLAGMGRDYESFLHNGELIKLEFAHITDEQFNAGRRQFFENLLARDYIYRLPYFVELYQDKALENIHRYLEESQ